MGCYDEDALERFLEQGGPADLAAALERHLRGCRACRDRLDVVAARLLPAPPGAEWSGSREYVRPAAGGPTGTDPVVRAWAGALKTALLGATPHRNAGPDDPADDAALPTIPGLEIRRRIGSGGMGVVYEAFDPALKRRVAVKMLRGLRQSPEGLARLRVEAEAAARVSHPGIVGVHRLGEADGQPWIELEYVEGPSLAERLGGRPQPPREAAALALSIADALAAAHRRRVIHRDLKPTNILLDTGGRPAAETPLSELVPKISDFGLAKVLDADTATTRDGQLVGALLALSLLGTTVGAVVAAVHFRALERDRDGRRLEAEAALADSRRALADSFRTLGLRFADERRHHLAALCFAEATDRLPAEGRLRRGSAIRTSAVMRRCPRPAALLGDPTGPAIGDVTFHPTPRWLVAHPADRTAGPIVWDIDTASAVVLPASIDSPTALAWTGDGAGLVVGKNDGRVLVAGFPRFDHVDSVTDPSGVPVRAVAGSADGTRVAAATSAGLRCWARSAPAGAGGASWNLLWQVPSEPASAAVDRLDFAPDGRHVVSITGDGRLTVRRVDVPAGMPPVLESTCGRGAARTARIEPRFDPRGRLVVWSDGAVDWYDLDTGASTRTEPMPAATFCEVSRSTGDVAVGGRTGFMWCGEKGRRDFAVDTRSSACWLPDGGLLTGGEGSDTLIRWTPDFTDGSAWPLFQPDGVTRLRLSGDGSTLATTSAGNRLRVWRMPGAPPAPRHVAAAGGVGRMDVRGAGDRLLLIPLEGAPRAWELPAGVPTGHPIAGLSMDDAVAGGRLLATVGRGNRLAILDASTGRLDAPPLPHPNDAFPAALSADGRLLLTRGLDRHFRLWDWRTGTLVMPPATFPKEAAAGLADEDRVLVVVWSDGACHLLDTADAQPLCAPLALAGVARAGQAARTAFASTPDGRTVVIGHDAGLWILDLGEILGEPTDDASLTDECRLISGHRFVDGQPTPLEPDVWDAAWRGLGAASP